MKKRILIVAGLVVIVAALLTVRLFRGARDDGTMLLSGNVEVTETNMAFKIPGRVVERLVDEGDRVKAGDVIARLDRAEQAAVVAQNGAAVKEAAARLSELLAGSRPQEIGQAQAGAGAQEAELEKVKKDFQRAEILYRNGAIAASGGAV